MYYSYSGKTKTLAEEKAKELDADIEEIVEVKRPFILVGIFRALRRKKTGLRPIESRLGNYDKIIIMSPVWAGHPVSAINGLIEQLPTGKQVEVVMVSAGGGTKRSAKGTKALITMRGCEVVEYTDV